MLPAIIRQTSAFILSRKQPEYQRFLYSRINFDEPLICIKGARGCGKTTLMLQHAHNSQIPIEKILYVACDHPAMVDVNLHELAQIWYQEGGKMLLVDEIHKAKGFAASLKSIRDGFDLQVLFSGSSALRIDHELADLSRRAVVYHLPVLSLREFIELETGEDFVSYTLAEVLANHQAMCASVCARIRPIEYLLKYYRYGAYPFYRESVETYPQKLLSVINTTIDSDLCTIYNIEPSKAEKLKKIMYMLCSTAPVEMNKSKLGSAIGTSWPTVSNYLARMQAGSLIHQVPGGTRMRAVNKPDKLLLNNPNLFHVLCAAPDTGALRESFFVSQLSVLHQVHYHDRGDFVVDDQVVFEIGGPRKTARQLDDHLSAHVVADGIETGTPQQIPLWLFGMLY